MRRQLPRKAVASEGLTCVYRIERFSPFTRNLTEAASNGLYENILSMDII